MANAHIPSPWNNRTPFNHFYAEWLKGYNWTYILTIRRHFPLTESACMKMADGLLKYSPQVKTIWMALEKDRGDGEMNHLHVIIETGELKFQRKEMVEALGLKKDPKSLTYFSSVDSSDAVAIYCAKRVGKLNKMIFHDFRYQGEKT